MLGSWIVVWGSVSCVGTDRWNKKKGIWIFSKIENSDSLFYIRSDGVNVDCYQVHPGAVWISSARYVRISSIWRAVSGLLYGMRSMIRFR